MSLIRFFYCLILILGLTQCGFSPLYQQHDSPYLSQVKIGVIEERSGQMLRNLLLKWLAGFKSESKAEYQLNASIQYSMRDLAVQKDATTSRSQVLITVSFSLIHIHSGKVLLSGTESATADYNILSTSPYSTLISKKDAHNRLLENVSGGIQRQIATFFKTYNLNALEENPVENK